MWSNQSVTTVVLQRSSVDRCSPGPSPRPAMPATAERTAPAGFGGPVASSAAGGFSYASAAEPELDIPRLLAVAMVPYSLLTAVMHPLNVMKTRAQSQSSSVPLSRFAQFRMMVGANGVRGLFAGLGPVLAGAVPARTSYIAALETTRKPAEEAAKRLGASSTTAAAAGHGCAGLAAAGVSMLIYVPVDVVSQKLMVEPSNGTPRPTFGGVVHEVTSGPSGWRGLYRGLGLTMLLGLPAGSIWWATYGAVREWLSSTSAAHHHPELAQKAAAATTAAIATVATIAPLDTIKTHHQLAVGTESATALAARLVRRDGVLSLYAGSTPRVLHLALWSTCLVCVYEELKRTCVKT